MSGFFAFGGYEAYIWAAYGISALALVAMTALVWCAYWRAKRQV